MQYWFYSLFYSGQAGDYVIIKMIESTLLSRFSKQRWSKCIFLLKDYKQDHWQERICLDMSKWCAKRVLNHENIEVTHLQKAKIYWFFIKILCNIRLAHCPQVTWLSTVCLVAAKQLCHIQSSYWKNGSDKWRIYSIVAPKLILQPSNQAVL